MPPGKIPNKKKSPVQPAPELKTEGPLKEKDEQGQATEQARQPGQKALEQWRLLRQKIAGKFKR